MTVIQNATILTVTHGTIEKGSILIRDGKIAEVGRNVAVPSGATVIDAAGKFVMPGIIDCHSHIAVDGGVNEGSVSVSSMVGIEDVLDPEDIDIYRALAGGVTTSNVLHGSANAIGGKNQVIKLRWGKDAQGLMFEGAMPGIKFALGENPKRSNRAAIAGADARYPATRMGVMDTIREAFVEAKAYQRRWADYRAKAAKGDKTAVAPRRDLRLEPLVEVLEGKRLVHAHSYRADEILQLLRVAEEFGLQDRDAAARARGLSRRRRDREARRRRVDVLRLVGVQGRGLRRHALQRGADDRARRRRVDQLRQRRGSIGT